MYGCIFWFLLLASSGKSITRKLPLSRNWYITPMLWPVDHVPPARLKTWPPPHMRYGKYFRSTLIPNAATNSMLIDKYSLAKTTMSSSRNNRSNKNDLRNLILKNSNFQISKPQVINQTRLPAYNLAYDFQPHYLQQVHQLPQPSSQPSTDAPILEMNAKPLYTKSETVNTATVTRNLKYCRRDPAYAQRTPKLQLTQATLLPTSAYTRSQEYDFQINQRPSHDAPADVKQSSTNFQQSSFKNDNSHSFFTLNDAVTPAFERHQNDAQEKIKYFAPTIIPTLEVDMENKYKSLDYIEQSESNTSAQKLLPESTVRSMPPVIYTTDYPKSITTESSVIETKQAITTVLPTEMAPTGTTTAKIHALNSTKHQSTGNKRYVKKLGKTTPHTTRLTLQKIEKSRLAAPPRIKLKSKHEFFRQVRFGKVSSSQTPDSHEAQSDAPTNADESMTNVTLPAMPTTTPSTTSATPTPTPTKIKSTKRVRFQKTATSPATATRIENIEKSTRPSRGPEQRNASKQRNLKRYFRKSSSKNDAVRSESNAPTNKPSSTVAPVQQPHKRTRDQHPQQPQPANVEKSQSVVKSTQSTIMKISANKNNVEITKQSQNSLESRRHPKEAAEKINVQPLPIEIFFQNQLTSSF